MIYLRKSPEQGIRMNPYYQPPRYDEEEKAEADKQETPPIEYVPSEPRPPRFNWYTYVAGFLLLLAGICLVLSNSLDWHPTVVLPRVPPAASDAK